MTIAFALLLVMWLLYRRNTPRFESYIEERLYSALISKGYNVRTQVPCGPYRIDLVLPSYGIAIECDGRAFHSSPDQKKYDKKRSAYLYKRGYRSVLRFSGSEIVKNPNECIKKIENKVLKF